MKERILGTSSVMYLFQYRTFVSHCLNEDFLQLLVVHGCRDVMDGQTSGRHKNIWVLQLLPHLCEHLENSGNRLGNVLTNSQTPTATRL